MPPACRASIPPGFGFARCSPARRYRSRRGSQASVSRLSTKTRCTFDATVALAQCRALSGPRARSRGGQMSFRWWDRWGPLAGIVSVALMVISFVVAGSSPDTQDDDAKIVSYYTQNSNQVKNLVALLIFAIGVLFMIAFFAALRERLRSEEHTSELQSHSDLVCRLL